MERISFSAYLFPMTQNSPKSYRKYVLLVFLWSTDCKEVPNSAACCCLAQENMGGGYSHRNVQVFSTLANHVTVAVENALNYESLSESNRQLQLLHDKLVQAEKMAAIGEMTTILAHELKNSLGIIRNSAQFLVKGKRKPAMQQKLQGYIVDEVDNLNLVISNFLGLARHKPPPLSSRGP